MSEGGVRAVPVVAMVLPFVGHDLSKSQPRGALDANVHELPAGAADLVAPVVRHTVAWTDDPAGKRSAAQPPQVAKKSIGAEAAAATMPSSAFEPVS